ncbi:MAG: hypothetical protein ACRDTU_01030 [Micromonosporaceae bacterium]
MADAADGGGGGRPVPKGAETLSNRFDTAFGEIRKDLARAQNKFKEIVDLVNEWWDYIPPGARYWVAKQLKMLKSKLDELIKHIKYALKHHTPVLSLIYASFEWLNDVRNPASGVHGMLTKTDYENVAIGYWTGGAATAYASRKAVQQEAVKAFYGNAEEASKWLMGIAKANVAYAVQLAKVLSEVAGELAQAAADATTVINIPWAIDALAGSVGTLVTGALDALLEIANTFMNAVGNARDIYSRTTDESVFGKAGEWPEAVTI